ncbi:UDP-2,3-diacylglucosamine pyrophosphatase LpxH [Rhodoligotrophos appendicifer]|uniref:UDP-2,3-diacylglucosamine diphosphatase n=1 Tax=Rhodoligotrophos appendicifer TaxID=987056 RepID=UPI001FE7BD84|nr:UDP-2,3-diacylglucosamine diphosphatase [Rhodoligotrophos appendicifer]
MNQMPTASFRYRTIWISDLHLGTRRAQTELLLNFLRHTESDTLYLVGDVVDNWALKKRWYWTQTHNDVIQKVLRKARKGTKVIYIPGNHDEYFRDFVDARFGRISVQRQAMHIMADGKRYLVIHGDEFDGVVRYAKWLALLGDNAYGLSITINVVFNRVRRLFGLPYWSLSAYLKHKVKRAVEFVSRFETALVREARQRGADGVICGHVHTPQIRDIDGIHYCNDGDWVESCTALVESFSGKLEIIHWVAVPENRFESFNAHPDRERRLVPAD